MGARILLRQLLRQRLELGEVLERAGTLAHPHALLTLEALTFVPAHARPGGSQLRVHLRELVHQVGRTECLLRQLIEFGALFLRQRVVELLGRSTASGQRVDQLVCVAGVLGKELAVLVHELTELLGGVLAVVVRSEELVQILEHVSDTLPVLFGGALERLLHARESLIEEFTTEQVFDLLVVLLGRRTAPVVIGQVLHRLRG